MGPLGAVSHRFNFDMINKGRAVRAMLNSVLWNRQITRKNELLIYNSIVKSAVTYGAETWKFDKNLRVKTYVDENGLLKRSQDAQD